MSHDDFDFEPMRGLPRCCRKGSGCCGRAAPMESLAVRAYHVRKVAVYFAVLVLWRVAVGLANAQSLAAVILSSLFILLLGGIAFGVLSLSPT